MKPIIVQILIFLFSFSLSAQEKTLQFGASLSPSYVFASVIDNGSTTPSIISLVKDNATGKLGSTTQVFVEYVFNEHSTLKLSGGYQFSGLRTKELEFTDANGTQIQGEARLIDNFHQMIFSIAWRQYLGQRLSM